MQKPILSHMSCRVKFSSQASLDLPSSLPPLCTHPRLFPTPGPLHTLAALPGLPYPHTE